MAPGRGDFQRAPCLRLAAYIGQVTGNRRHRQGFRLIRQDGPGLLAPQAGTYLQQGARGDR
ncbi:hypothetical protein D3C81_2108040 [compost metagenome]